MLQFEPESEDGMPPCTRPGQCRRKRDGQGGTKGGSAGRRSARRKDCDAREGNRGPEGVEPHPPVPASVLTMEPGACPRRCAALTAA